MRDEKAWKWLNENELSYRIWEKKYRHNNESFDAWLDRVSGGDQEVRQLIQNKDFIFGGRILSGRGVNDAKYSLSNCYVITPPEDNIESIFECATKMARTFSYGGGAGTDLSKLAPKGAIVRNSAKQSDGVVPFVELLSSVTGTIAQNSRRGAAIVTLDCTHPDIIDFINLKTDLNKCNFANISIKVNDEFMNAAINKQPWKLSFTRKETGETIEKEVNADDVLTLLAQRNWEMAEPGLLYWTRVESHNMLSQDPDFQYVSTNPCGEIPMASGNSCLLGSINLDQFVTNPFTNEAYIDLDKLRKVTDIAVRALNKVLDEGLPKHPLQEQKDAVRDWRQIGLGTTSLATALIRYGVTYGSVRSLDIVKIIYKTIAQQAILTSLDLAKKDGMYPNCKPELIVKSDFFKQFDWTEQEIADVRKYGLRNCQILTCAPNGSVGSMIGTGSTGIESLFALSYYRTTKTLENKDKTFKIDVPVVTEYKQATGNEDLPDYFVSVYSIDPLDRIRVQATAQQWIDGAISSTCNIPETATVEDVKNIYINAWKLGCKGCTIFRDNCKRTAILSTTEVKEETLPTSKLDSIVPVTRKELGKKLEGASYKCKNACGGLYITINNTPNGDLVEVFANPTKQGGCKANLESLTRQVSDAMRSGIKISSIIDSLAKTQCQACVRAKAKGEELDGSSCGDIVAKCIQDRYNELHNIKPTQVQKKQPGDGITTCPECGEKLRYESGCRSCSCGWSKCG